MFGWCGAPTGSACCSLIGAWPRQRVGVIHGFVLGLLLDLIEGAPLGQNALTLSLLAYLFLLLYQRFRVYSIWQQAVLVFVLLGIGSWWSSGCAPSSARSRSVWSS